MVFVLRSRGILTERVVARTVTLSPFSLSLHYDKLEPSHLCRDGVYPSLQGVMCAHLKGVLHV